jgi:hypothetical protein
MREYINSLKEDLIEADQSAFEMAKEEQKLFKKQRQLLQAGQNLTMKHIQRQIIVKDDKTSKNGLFNTRKKISDEEIVKRKMFH